MKLFVGVCLWALAAGFSGGAPRGACRPQGWMVPVPTIRLAAPALARRVPSPEPSGRDEAVAVTQDLLIELIEMDDPAMASVAAAVVPRVEVLMQCNVVEAAAELEKELEATGGLGPDEALARKAIASATDLLVEFLEEFVGQMGGMQAQQQQLLYAISAASKESEAALDQLLKRRRMELDTGFVAYLSSEAERIGNLPPERQSDESQKLARFLGTVRTRVVAELEAMTKDDTVLMLQLLESNSEQQATALNRLLTAGDGGGVLQRLRSLVAVALAEMEGREEAPRTEAPGRTGDEGDLAGVVRKLKDLQSQLKSL
eukprot:CAMPEP_0182524736 /NCGR_PEP_ID=MMETSP1323-20130603/1998_1 /TAXON_ID=236787 /ORGANISM="Florenciella parvula, Strain RCC1693" /LENGTH=315 /DNA_ID=CAMNT_0024733353 /DNA_START=39 /DNA_END=986 /DNA_ORIENTATION=+